MLSRVADDLYWVARYVERGIAVSRLVDVTRHLELDAGTEDFWAPLVGRSTSPATTCGSTSRATR